MTEWTESYIATLPREDNRVERKASKLLADENEARRELAKQLSAFANTGGGAIVIGANDDGTIDGGYPLIRKGRQTTKEWLEDIIPSLTEFEIVGFRVLDIARSGDASQIQNGNALYVIEVPDSDRAPHQSASDYKYYVRIGAKSRPAPHRLVEDIRNRSRYPLLEFRVNTIEI